MSYKCLFMCESYIFRTVSQGEPHISHNSSTAMQHLHHLTPQTAFTLNAQVRKDTQEAVNPYPFAVSIMGQPFISSMINQTTTNLAPMDMGIKAFAVLM